MTKIIFAANWKMNHGPPEARGFLDRFLGAYQHEPGREVWFFPPAVSIESVAQRVVRLPGILVGAQNVYWKPKGAFTGELSVSMAKDAGARAVLVGHSERRHVFGETDDETGRKVRAVLDCGMTPLLCVGETLRERDSGMTLAVIHRQLAALDGLDGESLARIVVAYEPVWAIGTGKNATPADAAAVHAAIHGWFEERAVAGGNVPVLYGGSVKPGNAQELLSEDDIDGVLVGGASLEPESWQAICAVALD